MVPYQYSYLVDCRVAVDTTTTTNNATLCMFLGVKSSFFIHTPRGYAGAKGNLRACNVDWFANVTLLFPKDLIGAYFVITHMRLYRWLHQGSRKIV